MATNPVTFGVLILHHFFISYNNVTKPQHPGQCHAGVSGETSWLPQACMAVAKALD